MSNVFLEDGRELTAEEWERDKYYFVPAGKMFFGNSIKSLFWLGHALKLPYNFDLARLIKHIEAEGTADLYNEPRFIPKPEGGTRIIISPKPELKLVQQRINTLLLDTFKPNKNTFGYRGGTCLEVAERHRNWPSTLKLDIKDAFFRVNEPVVSEAIRSPFHSKYCPELSCSGFSWTISKWIAQLCTYFPVSSAINAVMPGIASFLPQGAPTSPICFDLSCNPIDEKLERIAERVGGIFSRYADNYYFSTRNSRISPKLERIIVCTIGKSNFPIHKVRRVDQGELLRILGYNILKGKIKNTRGFRRRLRCALYVLKTKLERGLDWEDADNIVKGYMGFAKNLPLPLRQAYKDCEKMKNLK